MLGKSRAPACPEVTRGGARLGADPDTGISEKSLLAKYCTPLPTLCGFPSLEGDSQAQSFLFLVT